MEAMDANTGTSFIPHDAGTPARSRRSGGGLADVILMLAILAFAASAALAVGVFLYHQFLSTQANADLAKLASAEKQFQPELVDQLERLDKRMHSASSLLSKHLAPSAFFTILDAVTAKTISYSTLSFLVSDTVKLDMDGVARSVNSVAFQADLLSKEPSFESPIFSNLDRQKDGVHFHLSTLINPDSINFEALTGSVSSVPTTPAPVQTETSTNAPSTPVASSSPPTPSAP